MFKVLEYSKKTKLRSADYILEDSKSFYKVKGNLTPKIEGFLEVLVVNPSIKEAIGLLEDSSIPEWLNITIYLQNKKLEEVCLRFPEFQPKKISFKEESKKLLTEIDSIIDTKAFNVLVDAFRGNIVDLQQTLEALDRECTTGKITLKDVQGKVNYTKPVYATDVLEAFFKREKQRWKIYYTFVSNLGDEYAYNALYKCIKTQLKQKADYLQNKDVTSRLVKHVDAPFICYAYTLFSQSTNFNQLYGLMVSLDRRSAESLERISNADL